MKTLVDLAEQVAWSCHNLPYRWGGDDPLEGFDCSGFCIEILKSVGLLSKKGDWTAAGLWDYFKDRPALTPEKGCLVFYGDPPTHVEFVISKMHSMGASGGGRASTSEEAASRMNAYIKVRPINRQTARFRDPFMLMRGGDQ
jgi:cell wall-associated NlpC family hydrolase